MSGLLAEHHRSLERVGSGDRRRVLREVGRVRKDVLHVSTDGLLDANGLSSRKNERGAHFIRSVESGRSLRQRGTRGDIVFDGIYG